MDYSGTPSQLIDDDAFIKLLDISLLERRPGYARAMMPVADKLKNGAGFVQGGAIFTLADYTCAAAFNSGERFGMTVNSSVSFIGNFREGVFYAEAQEISGGKKLAFYRVTVTNQDGAAVAEMSITAYYIG